MRRLGLVIATGRERELSPLLDRARRAEAAGAEALWSYEDYAFADAFVTLGALASVTQRVTLGTAVTNPFTRHPVLLAMSAATVDRLSGGRAMLGLGRSLDATMKTQYGIEYGDPYRVLEDTGGLLKKLWRGETISEGRLHEVRLDNLPSRPDIPILISGVGDRAFRLAGRLGAGVIFHVFASPELVRANVAAFEAAGGAKDAEKVVLIPLALTDRPERFRQALRQRIAFLLSLPGNGDRLAAGARVNPDALRRLRQAFGTQEMLERGLDPFTHTRTPELMAAGARELPPGIEEQLTLLGDATAVKRRMDAYEAAGATSFMLELFTEGVDQDETIQRLGELRD